MFVAQFNCFCDRSSYCNSLLCFDGRLRFEPLIKANSGYEFHQKKWLDGIMLHEAVEYFRYSCAQVI